ncbi:MAG: hypothetical protein B9S27_02970 [Opitutia bacterium Tous-C8FEB]|jgi:hypothetical protein|nr:MAG: hypothetical protein B9S27_02970 [Opitutae bacterium Tous-C8FEB]
MFDALNRRLPIIALLLAWVCANGALLDAAQVLAWAKMFRGYAAVMPAGEALAKTFDPASSCRLCVRVAAARRAAREQLPAAIELSAEKLTLAVHRAVVFTPRPPAPVWPEPGALHGPRRVEAVPVRPPRV